MNFTVEQFLSVFEKYNQAVWPMQFVAYALGIVLVVLALTKWKRASFVIFGALAVTWAGMAIGYMWLYFAEINKAAYLFGVIFLAQAVLLAIAAVKERNVPYGRRRDARTWVGLALIVYAMLVYPLLGAALGHGYPRAPMFGLVPCPTTIFTFGMLLLAARPRRLLLWLPLVWSAIGFFAALKFGIREDIGLLLAAIATTVISFRFASAREGATRPASLYLVDLSRRASGRLVIWTGFVVAALLTLDIVDSTLYGAAIPAAALVLALIVENRRDFLRLTVDRLDLALIAGLYVVVVGLFALAFRVFTTDDTLGLFLSFAAGLILGVVVPIVYTVWIRRRTLASLGLTLRNWRVTVVLALVFGGVQFAITLYGYELPSKAVEWVPLLVMSLAVGAFEAVFFRGFMQGRLEASLGRGPAVLVAAGLYALYHVGYGMGGSEMLFLFGLGVVYAIAYQLTENVLVLWPLLTPLGAFFNNLQAGDIELPWASIAGFADVLAVFAITIALAARNERRFGRRVVEPAVPGQGTRAAARTSGLEPT